MKRDAENEFIGNGGSDDVTAHRRHVCAKVGRCTVSESWLRKFEQPG